MTIAVPVMLLIAFKGVRVELLETAAVPVSAPEMCCTRLNDPTVGRNPEVKLLVQPPLIDGSMVIIWEADFVPPRPVAARVTV